MKYEIMTGSRQGAQREIGKQTYLIDSNRLSIQPHLVHDPRSVLRILLTNELHKAIALVRLCDPIFWQMYVDDTSSLQHKLPDQTIRNSLVDVADIDRSFFVLLPNFYINFDSFFPKEFWESNLPVPCARHLEVFVESGGELEDFRLSRGAVNLEPLV
jgi:hypothetical protein